MPIGTILAYTGLLSKIPAGWHLCDGSAGTPDLRNQFLMGWGNNYVNSFIMAGLPNIVGTYADTGFDTDGLGTGAFTVGYTSTVNRTSHGGSEGSELHTASFDASLSNSIYGRSNTVQPPAYVVYYIMKIK